MYSIYWIVLLVALVEGKSTHIQVLKKEFVADAINGSVHCAEELGLPVDTLNSFLSNNFEDSLNMRKYIYCLGKAVGVGEENGSLNHSLSKFGNDDKRKAEILKIVDECNKEEASDKYEKAFKVSACYLNSSSVQFKIE